MQKYKIYAKSNLLVLLNFNNTDFTSVAAVPNPEVIAIGIISFIASVKYWLYKILSAIYVNGIVKSVTIIITGIIESNVPFKIFNLLSCDLLLDTQDNITLEIRVVIKLVIFYIEFTE